MMEFISVDKLNLRSDQFVSPLHGPFSSHAVISLDSRIERNDEIRLKAITRNLLVRAR